jgi:hypothetical protein
VSCCSGVDRMSKETTEAFDHAMHMLFTARWNIPQASLHMGRTPSAESWTETKAEFRQYCVENPACWSDETTRTQRE